MSHKSLIAVLALCAVGVLAQETSNTSSQNQTHAAPRRIRVSGAVIVGLVEHRTLPEYPEAAIKAGFDGDVILKVLIDETGKVVLSEPVEGQPLLIAASTDALRSFHFRPYQLNGTPIQVETQIGFHFGVKGRGDKAKGDVEYMSTIPYRPEFRTGVMSATGAYTLWPRKVSGAEPHGAEPQLPPELAGKAGAVYLTVVIGTDGKVQESRSSAVIVGSLILWSMPSSNSFTSLNWLMENLRPPQSKPAITLGNGHSGAEDQLT